MTRGLIPDAERRRDRSRAGARLTHIRNRDVRLLVIAVVFVGIFFSFVGEMAFRSMRFGGVRGGSSRRSSGMRRDNGGGHHRHLVALAMIAVAYALAIVIRFALSRRREFLADAGACELTKNPDAMISALQKISGNATVNAPSEVREMFIRTRTPISPASSPRIRRSKRIEALARIRRRTVAPPTPPAPPQPSKPVNAGPWG
ncbi:MAG: M48 family metalloprotease [Hyphomonadaceae bacterium]